LDGFREPNLELLSWQQPTVPMYWIQLCTSGRFEQVVDKPDVCGREAIFKITA
jgi:hypothetical protein